jgi:hypothetical protein
MMRMSDGGSRPVSAVYPRLQVLKVFPSSAWSGLKEAEKLCGHARSRHIHPVPEHEVSFQSGASCGLQASITARGQGKTSAAVGCRLAATGHIQGNCGL